MAQDFTRYIARSTGTAGATIFTADSDDAVISVRLANIITTSIVVDVFITSSSLDYYLIKGITIPIGSSLELIDGASRLVMTSGDALKVSSNTNNSLDVWVSVVDAIST